MHTDFHFELITQCITQNERIRNLITTYNRNIRNSSIGKQLLTWEKRINNTD